MYTIDVNIFARDLDPGEPEHFACHNLLDLLADRRIRIIVPTLLLAELAGTISRTRRDTFRARVIAMALRDLPHLTFVELNESLAILAAELAADYRLRGADAVYAAVAQRYGTVLITLDVEQRTRIAPVVPTMTPTEVLADLETAR
jgi:predicted nucleic acid-binding protein